MANRFSKQARAQKADAAEHYNRLAEEFGHARRGYRSVDSGRGGRTGELFWQPLSLFIMALLALIAVSGMQARRLGWLDFMFGSGSAQAPQGSKHWMMQGRGHNRDGRLPNAEDDAESNPEGIGDAGEPSDR